MAIDTSGCGTTDRPDGIRLHRVGEEDWRSHRDLRLQMLLDTPDAFWTAYEDVADRTEADWRQAIRGAAHLQARDAVGTALGTVGILAEAHAADIPLAEDEVNLIAMYVVPHARGQGIGRLLLTGATELTRRPGRRRIVLEVTSSNAAAIGLYERLGFGFTGRSTPHPRRADLAEREMELRA